MIEPADGAGPGEPRPDEAARGEGEPQLPAVQHWPPGAPIDEARSLGVSCPACNVPWRVHDSMAGFRLRCRCGSWIEVPAPAAPSAVPTTAPTPNALATTSQLPVLHQPLPADERGLVSLPIEPGAVVLTPISVDLPLAPGALLQASSSNQVRWTSRTALEFAAMLAALFVPQIAAGLLTQGREFVLLLPLADLLSGALLLVVLAFVGPYAGLAFRRAAPRYWLEAAAMTLPFLLLAHLWLLLLRQAFPDAEDPLAGMHEQLGLAAALFVVAVSPAVLEEVIFRGALQGRLTALLGERVGLIVTAMAFALCHMAPAVLLIHVSIGLYLGWLRQRCGSLLPGMLLHFLYNGSLVLLS